MSFLKRRVGLLGGGQLARMLALEGARMGLEMHVLSSSPSDPAAQVTSHWMKGDLSDTVALTEFFKRVDFVTIESEFIDPGVVLAAEAESGRNLTPALRLVAELSDRLKQKTWLENFKIPTSPFTALLKPMDAESFFATTGETRDRGVVLKKRRFGYDGYGTFIVRSQKELETWLIENSAHVNDFIVEKFVPFRRELALQFAINGHGQICEFPLVEWRARNSKCHWVQGPVTLPASRRLNGLKKKIRRALVTSGYVGFIAFELFDTGREILVNEVAPRVHNSAHHSLESLCLNQFSAHLRAIMNLDLPQQPAPASKGFAMVNLIGTSEQEPLLPARAVNEVFFHWYGKSENRLGRKMGHMTRLADKGPEALKKLLTLEKKMGL
jgi:5-(carboxyamino)imidazole ribonucleotide synthase